MGTCVRRAAPANSPWLLLDPVRTISFDGADIREAFVATMPSRDLAARGWVRGQLAEGPAPEPGLKVSGYAIQDVAGVPTRVAITQSILKADLAAAAAAAVDAERDRRIDGGFVHEGVAYQTGAEDRANIAGAGLSAFMAKLGGAQAGDLRWHGEPTDFAWIATDNSRTPMDVDQVIAFYQAGVAFKSRLIFAARAKKDWLEQGSRTRAQILAFDPLADWPQ